ncbi:glycosyltransferase involved in cell wall biosynthesis [Halohasta litchfieldiae]|jgi:glycosyltransferase involved in cell wall biosynthesis|uniref:Glycosyltransferase involved in cell wall bisynthesis n=1 Tax=Halohasta litchfieldiae TaxID=1073996 RepID=A0A1H6XME4_9EURY|nr:glycosyltransferase [Halohasta litchfieldiae]ATW89149.1 glycosyltransferase involved in cell wall biosynthesis [Halohasta litchfieldiae]SEJ29336.1 Glycosyltransferase involved in cell wall bisynthesis [Halohasta litchfieldiae]
MHILYLLNEFPKLSESFVINEIHGLEQRGHEISIIALKKTGEIIKHDELAELDATVRFLPSPGVQSAIQAVSRPLKLAEGYNQLQLLSMKKAIGTRYIAGHLNREIRSLPNVPDHIHTHFFDWPKFSLSYIGFDIPMTITAHAFGLFQEGTNTQRRALADRVDRIVTISEYNRTYLRETVGIGTPIDVVRMGIRSEKFNPIGTTVDGRFLTVARFVEKKGIRYAIDAITAVADQYPEIEYHIIGSGPLEADFREQIVSNGLTEQVQLLGRVSDERLIQELNEASAFLLPCVIAADGDRDGIPVALMEAMAMKTVPISTTASGIPELIQHNKNGLLVEPKDSEQLSATIMTLLSNPQRHRELAAEARKRVCEMYNVTQQVDGMINVMNRCAEP